MKKKKITIEYDLNSKSPNIIWGLISTEGGLGKWIADEVSESKDAFTFTWGDVLSHHEIRRAKILERVRNSHIRMQWEDETDPEAYLELRMLRSEITDGFTLHITDYALPDDVDSLLDIWEQNIDQLHLTSGAQKE